MAPRRTSTVQAEGHPPKRAIEVSPDLFYAERVDDFVTVYYSQETNEVIGSLVKGVTKFCKTMLQQMPGFKIEICDGRVSLG